MWLFVIQMEAFFPKQVLNQHTRTVLQGTLVWIDYDSEPFTTCDQGRTQGGFFISIGCHRQISTWVTTFYFPKYPMLFQLDVASLPSCPALLYDVAHSIYHYTRLKHIVDFFCSIQKFEMLVVSLLSISFG